MATSSASRLDQARLEHAFDLMRSAVAAGEIPVGLLAVANGREIIRCEGCGPEGSIPTDGIFLIASITKPIVATAIMRLAERGRLLVEDPVVKYIPEFGVNGKEAVTVWHLLTHTSGMVDDYMAYVPPPATPEKDLRGALATSLRFPAGSRYQYCNSSFRILGEVIHRVSGKSYQDYLRDEVFLPAGMVDTSFRPEPEKQPRVMPVVDFPEVPGGFESYVAAALPAGGLFSTAADLIAFGQSYLNQGMGRQGRVLSPATIAVMTSLHTAGIPPLDGTERPAYGLGWEKTVPQEARLTSDSGYGHGGMTGTYLWIEPEGDLVVVFLTNRCSMDRRVRKMIVNSVLACVV